MVWDCCSALDYVACSQSMDQVVEIVACTSVYMAVYKEKHQKIICKDWWRVNLQSDTKKIKRFIGVERKKKR